MLALEILVLLPEFSEHMVPETLEHALHQAVFHHYLGQVWLNTQEGSIKVAELRGHTKLTALSILAALMRVSKFFVNCELQVEIFFGFCILIINCSSTV